MQRSIIFPLPHPHHFGCNRFTDNSNGKSETVQVVIVPVIFTQKDAFTWQIRWSCNFGKNCNCQNCIYAYRQSRERSYGKDKQNR